MRIAFFGLRKNKSSVATGSTNSASPFAKQFQTKGNLKQMGYWLKDKLNAQPEDRILVEFISSSEVRFTLIRKD